MNDSGTGSSDQIGGICGTSIPLNARYSRNDRVGMVMSNALPARLSPIPFLTLSEEDPDANIFTFGLVS